MGSLISKILILLFFSLLLFWSPVADASDCVNINTASKEELKTIIHIGDSRAEQIINLRKEAPFVSVDDLSRVVGIGPSRITEIKEQGRACVENLPATLQPSSAKTLQANRLKEIPVQIDPGVTEKRAQKIALYEQTPQPPLSRLVVSMALALAIFSGTIILTLKKKLKIS